MSRQNALFRPTPDFFTRNAIDFDYDHSALVPLLWLATLKQYWPNPEDRDCIEALQEWFGLLLTADTSFQKNPVAAWAAAQWQGHDLVAIIAKARRKIERRGPRLPLRSAGQFGM